MNTVTGLVMVSTGIALIGSWVKIVHDAQKVPDNGLEVVDLLHHDDIVVDRPITYTAEGTKEVPQVRSYPFHSAARGPRGSYHRPLPGQLACAVAGRAVLATGFDQRS